MLPVEHNTDSVDTALPRADKQRQSLDLFRTDGIARFVSFCVNDYASHVVDNCGFGFGFECHWNRAVACRERYLSEITIAEFALPGTRVSNKDASHWRNTGGHVAE
jgi:hypothetical protein